MSLTLSQMISVAVLHRPIAARAAIVLALLAGASAGIALGARETPVPDFELLRLLRAMAVIKLAFVALAAGVVLWRLQAPIRSAWLAGYVAVCFAMAAGPSLIWFSSQIILASVLLHAGIAASIVLLWREGTTSELLHAAVLHRRTLLRG